MNWCQFEHPLCYPYFVDTVVTSCSFTKELGGLNNIFTKLMATEFSEFGENIYGKPNFPGNQNRIDTELLTLNKKYLVSLFLVHVS